MKEKRRKKKEKQMKKDKWVTETTLQGVCRFHRVKSKINIEKESQIRPMRAEKQLSEKT